jgi:hydrogenase maturation protein HypF
MDARIRISITGIVQGVGFRPTVYNLAKKMGLNGYVLNTSRGVLIEVEGGHAERFAEELVKNKPPLSEIKTIKTEALPLAGYANFEIRLSEPAPGEFALISPDIATCPECIKELHEPADKRYLYPFINCTNCGPRYSIVMGVPYDRGLTTMKKFNMCPGCRAEYESPSDRRFHAEPTACPSCGPTLEFRGQVFDSDPMHAAISELKNGHVVAIKGLGGFQLACDARDTGAVNTLRDRKRKSQKPFALMAADVDTINKYCHVSEAEAALLTGRVRPIVLLKKKPGADAILAPGVSPGNDCLGFMLPYTPLHNLLFAHPGLSIGERPEVLVMTSGNLSEEPIVIDNAEAVERLSSLADSYLMHDRDIYMRVDDSVSRVVSGVPRLVRRARGYVPEPIDMGRPIPDILACGGELKNTLCITRGSYAIPSQHIGDLTNHESMLFFEETLINLKRTFKARPGIVAHDMHPDYLSTRFAQSCKADGGGLVTLVPVQHHHAHIASCMAENGYSDKVIGVAFDGTGYGTDGRIWGSEFLIADFRGFERFAHINYIPLPGGDRAVLEPWRVALSCLVQAFGTEAYDIFNSIKGASNKKEKDLVLTMIERGVNSPMSCGMGRLFDAVSSLIGLKDRITFEGEAAIALEMAAGRAEVDIGGVQHYPYGLAGESPVVIDTSPLIRAIVEDVIKGAHKDGIALRFHATVADMVFRLCVLARERYGLETAALSGGVFQNALLFETVERGLMSRGFQVLTHSQVPANDGGISLGQAAVAASTFSSK